jgi:hypothetical protein
VRSLSAARAGGSVEARKEDLDLLAARQMWRRSPSGCLRASTQGVPCKASCSLRVPSASRSTEGPDKYGGMRKLYRTFGIDTLLHLQDTVRGFRSQGFSAHPIYSQGLVQESCVRWTVLWQ